LPQWFSKDEFLMHETESGRTTNQIHARLQRLPARSRVPTFAGEGREPLSKGAIEPLEKRRLENASPARMGQQRLGSLQTSLSHRTGDLDHALCLRALDHRPKVQIGPDPQTGSTWTGRRFDLFTNRSANAARIRRPPIGQHQQRAQEFCRSAHWLEQGISQTLVPALAQRPGQPEPGRNPHGQSHPGNHCAPFDADLVCPALAPDRGAPAPRAPRGAAGSACLRDRARLPPCARPVRMPVQWLAPGIQRPAR